MHIFWFRRDLRTFDNTALHYALEENKGVQPIFIFDKNIVEELENNDARINFIYKHLQKINQELKKYDSSLKVYYGNPVDVFQRNM